MEEDILGANENFVYHFTKHAKKTGINLLAISKNSPSLHDDKGRDLVATTYMMSPCDVWVYYPVRKADKDRSLYGDIAIVKLCAESPACFSVRHNGLPDRVRTLPSCFRR